MENVTATCTEAMKKRIESFEKDLLRVRTGRASLNILDGIKVNYYGNPAPLNQVASLTTPDAKTIVISPFEKKLISEIEKSIQVADIGIQPTNDGNVIRLPIPALNEERRKDIAKQIRKQGEDAKVAIRKIRQDANTKVKKQEKDKEVNEDESKKIQKDIQTVTDKYIGVIDDKMAAKEKEVMSI